MRRLNAGLQQALDAVRVASVFWGEVRLTLVGSKLKRETERARL